MRPGLGTFQSRRSLQYLGVSVPGADDLQPERQAILATAARHANRRVAGEVEHIEIRHPGLAHIAGILPVDGDRVERLVLRGQRWPAHRRRQHQIVFGEPALYGAEMLGALVGRLQELLAAVGAAGADALDKARIELRRDLVDAGEEARRPIRLLQDTPGRLGIVDRLVNEIDRATERTKDLEACFACLSHLVVEERVADEWTPRDPQPLHVAVREASHGVHGRHAKRMWIGRMRTAEHVQHQRRIAHGARHDAEMDEVVEGVRHLIVRNDAKRRLHTDNAGAGGWQTRARSRVGRERQRPEPGRDRHGRATARAARCDIEPPRITRDAEQWRIGEQLVRELGCRGLADDDDAGVLQTFDRNGVRVRHVGRHRSRCPGGANTRGVDDVLHRYRYAMQRAHGCLLYTSRCV